MTWNNCLGFRTMDFRRFRSVGFLPLFTLISWMVLVSAVSARTGDYNDLLKTREQIEDRIRSAVQNRNQTLQPLMDKAAPNVDPRYQELFRQKAIHELPGSHQQELNDLYRQKKELSTKLSALEAEKYDALRQNFETGEIKEKRLIARRDQKIAEALNTIADPGKRMDEVRRIHEDYAGKSRQLVDQYRQPLIDTMIADVNAGLPPEKRIRQSLGQGLHTTDASGKKILNPKHRGWSGDIDFEGSEIGTKRLESLLNTIGIGTRSHAGYLDAKQLEITVNKTGLSDRPGSQFHQTQATVDALSKETYVSCSMTSEQAGRAHVEINDHYKKAASGLREPAEQLFQRKDRLQGMAKGALKAAETANLNHQELEILLKKAGFQGTPDDFRQQLDIIKTSPHATDALFDVDEMAWFQKACKETLDFSLEKTKRQSIEQLDHLKGRISDLRQRAAEAGSGGHTEKARQLTREADLLRNQEIDSLVKLEAVNTARQEKMAGKINHPKERILPLETRKTTVKPRVAVGGAVFMKFLDLKGWTEDFVKGVDQAVSEERQGDSSFRTWGRSVVYVMAESTGIPGIADLYRAEFDQADKRAEQEIAQMELTTQDANLRQVLTQSVKNRERIKALGIGTRKLAMGAIEGIVTAPSQAGTRLGELFGKAELETSEASKMAMDARLIQYNAQKMDRLQALMTDIRTHGYDEGKALERDALMAYFYGFQERHRADETLSVLADRWIEALENHDLPGLGPITAARDTYLHDNGIPLFDAGGKQTVIVKPGDILAFKTLRTGQWVGHHEVQWLVGGDNYKTVAGDQPGADRLKFDSTGMEPGNYAVAVRLIDTSGSVRKILAHQRIDIRLGEPFPVLSPFTIQATLGEYDGPILSDPVQNGDIVAFQAQIRYPDGPPREAELFWQVYDPAGRAVEGMRKHESVPDAVATRNHRFRFQLETFAAGKYTVELTHLFINDPEKNKTSAVFPFQVTQAVRIDRVLVTDTPEDQVHKPLLASGVEPLLYAYYSLGQGVQKATLTLTARNAASGQVLETVSVERPRPGETPPYRVGLSVPAVKVPAGRQILFETVISTPQGHRHTARTNFKTAAPQETMALPGATPIRPGATPQAPHFPQVPVTPTPVRDTGSDQDYYVRISQDFAWAHTSDGGYDGVRGTRSRYGVATKSDHDLLTRLLASGKKTPDGEWYWNDCLTREKIVWGPGTRAAALSFAAKPAPVAGFIPHEALSPGCGGKTKDSGPGQEEGKKEWLAVLFHHPEGPNPEKMWHDKSLWSPRLRQLKHEILFGPAASRTVDIFLKSRQPGGKPSTASQQQGHSSFHAEAARRIKALAPSLEAEVRKLAGDLSVLQYSIDNSKKALASDLAQLQRVSAPLSAKAQTMTKEQFMARHGAELQRAAQMESAYNEKTRQHNRLVDQRNNLIKGQKEIAALYESISKAWTKGDVKQCIDIANGSPLAKSFGYKPLYP